jgi:hypothetical protein
MKKRINTIDGKILVQGGTDNELKSNEIRVNADKSLTERVNGEIVNVGGSGGGGLRPITAEDVDIMFLTPQSEEVQPFSDVITLPANIGLGFYNYESGKELYFGPNTVLLVTRKDGAGYSINSTSYERTITLDIYTKD